MAGVEVQLKATRQSLEVVSAPVIASASVGVVRFAVDYSPEWAGFDTLRVIVRNGQEVQACEVSDGVAVAGEMPLKVGGVLECVLEGRTATERLTTDIATAKLAHSGKERG